MRRLKSHLIAFAAAVTVSALALPSAAAAATETFENLTPIAIPNGGAATPYPSTINVSGFSGPVEEVEVTIRNWNHTCPADTGTC